MIMKKMQGEVRRWEYGSLQETETQLDVRYMVLWNELQDTTFSSETIVRYIINLQKRIENSGAPQRDRSLFGVRYEGKDTYQELIRWCQERSESLYR